MRCITRKAVVIFVAFAIFSACGTALSLSAPYYVSDDEFVYLVGVHEAHTGEASPDNHFLRSYEYGWYAYPYVLDALYERLGHNVFKSSLLVLLVFSSGYAGYFLFRSLGLDWVPALILSLGLLFPRIAAGTEFFGIFTFNEAAGRSLATPLFLIATALIIKFLHQKRSLWPIFFCIGLGMFLHPATVMVFAGAALFATFFTLIYQRAPIKRTMQDVFVSGIAFVFGGVYMFAEVIGRLFTSTRAEGVETYRYVEAVLFRNAWEFPVATMGWTKHMAIVSVLLLAWALFFYAHRRAKGLRDTYTLPYTNTLIPWGFSIAVASVAFSFILPGLNLILMDTIDAPYIFQQWSRISKFYYLGIFLLLAPVGQALYIRFRRGQGIREKRKGCLMLSLFALSLVVSSSVTFEIAQFVFGYPLYNRGYIPQRISLAPSDTSPEDFREVCNTLSILGWVEPEEVVSGEFAFRYYCNANLYVTNEEGAAFLQLPRQEMVDWYARYMAQRRALNSGDPLEISGFAKSVFAPFVIVPYGSKFKFLLEHKGLEIATTSKHIILKVQ